MEETRMSENSNEGAPAEATESTEQQGDPADTPLGPNGEKALTAEREARKAAEKKASEAEAALKAIEDANKTAEQKAADEAAAAIKRAEAAEVEALRWRIAAKHGITDTDAETFLTGTTEESMTAQAARLTELSTTAGESKTPGPRPDLSQGARNGSTPKSTAEQFADAISGALS
jgi:hypothetical protein